VVLALASGVNAVQGSVVQEEVMFPWAQVALRFGRTLGDECPFFRQFKQRSLPTSNKASSLSFRFMAIGQLVGPLAIHRFNWVACISWTILARQRRLRCQRCHSTIGSSGRRYFRISLARYIRGSAYFANSS